MPPNPVTYPFTSLQNDSVGSDSNHPISLVDLMSLGTANDLAGWVRLIESFLRATATNLQWERWKGLNIPQSPSPAAPSYVSATQFTLTNDWTSASGTNYPAIAVVGRRVKAIVTAGIIYGTITVASFSGGLTTVTVVWDSGSLDAGLSEVQFGVPNPGSTGNSSLPVPSLSSYFGTAAGTNAYTVTLAPVPATLASLVGIPISVIFTNACTGAATLAPNGLAATPIKRMGAALVSGDIPAATLLVLVYDGTNFQIIGTNALDLQGTAMSASAPTTGQALTYNGTLWIPTTLPQTVQSYAQTLLGADVTMAATTDTTILTKALTMPASGGPFRVRVDYGLYLQVGTNTVFWETWVTDGSAVFASAQIVGPDLTITGGINAGAYSPVTYANGATPTITLKARVSAITGGGSTVQKSPAAGAGSVSWMDTAIVSS